MKYYCYKKEGPEGFDRKTFRIRLDLAGHLRLIRRKQ
jgi:hypothetical protein